MGCIDLIEKLKSLPAERQDRISDLIDFYLSRQPPLPRRAEPGFRRVVSGSGHARHGRRPVICKLNICGKNG
jgi:hypothetical protein